MKFLFLLLTLGLTSLQAEAPVGAQAIQVTDIKGEALAGVKIELLGTGRSYYTNLNGVCLIPQDLLKATKMVKVESISYKTKQLPVYDLNSKIILEFR
jgi:hypothetical protein